MKYFRGMVAISGVCLSLLAGRGAEAALVTVNADYDLVASALNPNYDNVNGLDWYTSLPIDLGTVNLVGGDQLRVNVTFRNATTLAGQTILLDQMGLGGAQNAPATFGSPAGVTGNAAGSHFFGPSLSLFGTGSVTTGTVTPTVASGLLSGGYTGGLPIGSCAAGSCNYGAIFQDLIDGNVTIGLSGFSVLFGAAGAAGTFTSLQFNLIAPAITVNAGVVPEPRTLLLVLGALLAAAGLAGQRRAAAGRSA